MMNVNADIYDKTNGKKHSKKRIMKGMLLVFARITSYNVCYTKLLRITSLLLLSMK